MTTKKKIATDSQLIAVAKLHDAIGASGTNGYLYGVTNGEKKFYAVGVWRDSMHNLAQTGILKYNNDFTYSIN